MESFVECSKSIWNKHDWILDRPQINGLNFCRNCERVFVLVTKKNFSAGDFIPPAEKSLAELAEDLGGSIYPKEGVRFWYETHKSNGYYYVRLRWRHPVSKKKLSLHLRHSRLTNKVIPRL